MFNERCARDPSEANMLLTACASQARVSIVSIEHDASAGCENAMRIQYGTWRCALSSADNIGGYYVI
jgi:hypothetical protein